MRASYSCANPTWTHADREAFADFRVLPGEVVSMDGLDADIHSWASRNTATLLTGRAASIAVLRAEKAGLEASVSERSAELTLTRTALTVKTAALSAAMKV